MYRFVFKLVKNMSLLTKKSYVIKININIPCMFFHTAPSSTYQSSYVTNSSLAPSALQQDKQMTKPASVTQTNKVSTYLLVSHCEMDHLQLYYWFETIRGNQLVRW